MVKSKISIYEIELDLSDWEQTETDEVPSFHDRLMDLIPTLSEHKCTDGRPGGFVSEVVQGTDFAHVIEHVILEMIRLIQPDDRNCTGWTRRLAGTGSYIIHYGAPDFLTGRLGAILALDAVKKLIRGEMVDLDRSLDMLRNPLRYFAQDEISAGAVIDLVEPASVIHDVDRRRHHVWPRGPAIKFTEEQRANIRSILSQVQRHMRFIVQAWSHSFLEYSGTFGGMIIDKVQLLNPDRFIDLLIADNYEGYGRAVCRASRLANSYRIQDHFIIQATWLFKSKLLAYITDEYGSDPIFLRKAMRDFNDFFQFHLQQASKGFAEQSPAVISGLMDELREFRELERVRGTVLVVDDDEMERCACRDILEYHGYRVLLADTPVQALKIHHTRLDTVSTILLGSTASERSDQELVSRMRTCNPETKILVMAPQGSNIDAAFSDYRFMEFISRPFSVAELGSKMESITATAVEPRPP